MGCNKCGEIVAVTERKTGVLEEVMVSLEERKSVLENMVRGIAFIIFNDSEDALLKAERVAPTTLQERMEGLYGDICDITRMLDTIKNALEDQLGNLKLQ